MSAKLEKQAVLDRLADLKRTDWHFKNFGAGDHQYELRRPLPECEIASFESTHGITLPLDYRDFITQIGNGGAGPYYGLFPFGYLDDANNYVTWESSGIVGDLSAEFPHQDKWNLPDSFLDNRPDPAPDISQEGLDRMMEAWDQELEEHYWNPMLMNGAIPICHRGCALLHWLVIHGAQKGFVWADDRADYAGLNPLRNDEGHQMTFTDWYLSWMQKPLRV